MDLQAERMSTIELSREQNLGKGMTLATSVFHYRLQDLIGGVPIPDWMLQYRNTSRASAMEMELEVGG